MEPTLDQVREELADIHEELLELPTDAFSRRAELRDRQNTLRQLSHQLADGQQMHDARSLKAAFDRLHEVRDKLLERHLAPDSTSVGDAGIDATVTAAINRAIDAGSGIDEIEAQLKEIVRQLKRRAEQ